jgi:tyrosyl-DNA phosphodiesterase 2
MCLSQLSKLPIKSQDRRRLGSSGVYLAAYINPEPTGTKPIHIATTKLACPIPPASMHFFERYSQAEKLIADLSREKNVVFGGDMSWDDKADLPFPLHDGWVDAACSLGQRSWTYDAFWNEKAGEFNGCIDYESMKKRSDRFVCKLQDYKLNSLQLIGDEPVGVEYKKVLEGIRFPLRPSCHRGLVLTIVPNF